MDILPLLIETKNVGDLTDFGKCAKINEHKKVSNIICP